MGLINEMDKVDVFYVNDDPYLNVIVRHVPCDTGDMWYFEHPDGAIIAQNPCSSNLDTIVKK